MISPFLFFCFGNIISVSYTHLDVYKRQQVASVTTTGYGEELVKNAFRCDYGLVETVAHFTAAKYFMPEDVYKRQLYFCPLPH